MSASDSSAMLPLERQAKVVELLRARGTMRVHDLADQLQVSPITVRRDLVLLAEQGLIRKVRGGATLIDVGASARGPAVPRHPAELTLGMVVPSLDYYWPDVIKGARGAATAENARLVLRGATYQADEELRQLDRLIESADVDGVLVAPTTTGERGEDLVRRLGELDLPVVLVERLPHDEHRDKLESVVSDHSRGAGLAVRHLADLGHRRIGVSTTVNSPTSVHVRHGWREECARLGLPVEGVPDFHTVDQRDPTWPGVVDDLLDACLDSGTTALVVHSDPEAISLVQRCRERGIDVPGGLSVVTYDDEVAELCDPPLTAVRPPKSAVGRAAAALLIAALRDPDPHRPAHRVVIEPRLIVRSSSSAPGEGEPARS
ncbi:substrate-binding domain-containing protein [Saccharothrix variisporea]|uniref:DNA-binding LacI/PurR family transcriptional regulator n=1 Tax=Saccharothrix variisporea TaxID=543527 RepID=A0A495XLY2_9PSEU|nr:substrate-binding domain-containing protein [Saccharothrix variisporea]RKT74902.1 DNA-binding LacI/PurR family transcriptional regulator [Saccharothrix variisporea]